MEDPDLVWLECANDAMEDSSIVKQDQVILLPVKDEVRMTKLNIR